MAKRARLLFLCTLLLSFLRPSFAVDARFDLVGPRINVRVTRNGVTLPISEVPNLQPGDRIWLHPDLPPTQSVKYLLICVFLRGNTNPPPEDWFTRIETWQKNVREEGVFVTVPREAQQAVLFLAPETGGDFSTLKSAVRGRPGIFVRASQDLAEAGFEQSRIEKYLTDICRVPLADANELQKHSDLLPVPARRRPRPVHRRRALQRTQLRPHRCGQLHRTRWRRSLLRLRRRCRRPGPRNGQHPHRAISVHPGHRLPPERRDEPSPQHAALLPQPQVRPGHRPSRCPVLTLASPPSPSPSRALRWSSPPRSRMTSSCISTRLPALRMSPTSRSSPTPTRAALSSSAALNITSSSTTSCMTGRPGRSRLTAKTPSPPNRNLNPSG